AVVVLQDLTVLCLLSLVPLLRRFSYVPYTTLFRSPRPHRNDRVQRGRAGAAVRQVHRPRGRERRLRRRVEAEREHRRIGLDSPRSEEHTSELQSHLNLVYRLLLEKKK